MLFRSKLDVSVSTACAGPWTNVYSKQGTTLATGADQTTSFSPSVAGDFRLECVSLAAYANAPVLFVRFTNDNHYGNNIYIDDVVMSSSACTNGVDELTETSFAVFPNPATDAVNVIFNGTDADYMVSIMDLNGRVISTMNINNANGSQTVTFATENIAKGSYLVTVTSNGVTSTKTVIIR